MTDSFAFGTCSRFSSFPPLCAFNRRFSSGGLMDPPRSPQDLAGRFDAPPRLEPGQMTRLFEKNRIRRATHYLNGERRSLQTFVIPNTSFSQRQALA
ncbi:hypothetical protein [Lyngbya confervoides]|uniref:Uncharacterized protein n=1 Tax=Lyngbya confervoides BDU141951 TaxID=1574623 RepID=A0ABD4SZQ5_9CYAN|nr:hypothetical protein [Lyngbya confervoides]MCM1981610.1 hypothetical protein [Lyngbya confervoides BDU141951]